MKENFTINCQSSIKINGDKILYFDPFRVENETHDADIIFITHDHYDHYDITSINKIIKNDTLIVIPESIYDIVKKDIDSKQILTVVPNKYYQILDIPVKTVASYNTNKQFHPRNKNYVGYIITINNQNIYVAGDTDITDENKGVKCDIAFIPIGGTYTMNYQEAAELINIIKPKVVIPTHYGSIVGSLKDGENFKKLVNSEIKTEILIK